nr:Chain B, PVI [Human adenovirus D8]4PIS_B Chain B, PVI [Human adenovirus D8]4WX6_B Chain B, Pvi [Human adenovirus D8]4WX6_D Chain D, Pvi [Human adenovirus D8]4WX7_B Chain B, Pvi [Human adenovirus D8]4WX7_D Chain D, Pvi [Human adenovirus D8]
GVKSLKRRRCY